MKKTTPSLIQNLSSFLVLVFTFIGLVKTTFSQEDILTIKFDKYYEASENSNGFMKLFKCSDNGSFIHYGENKQIIFPENFTATDTALALNYFVGGKDAETPNQVLFLIGNYSSYKPIMYVDYNQNLDFSDDGEPIAFSSDSTAVVYLQNSENPSAKFPIKFFYLELKPELKRQVKSIIGSSPDVKGNKITDVDYWFADKRMNLRLSELSINGESLKIGIYDYNCNGLYNDKGSDRIIISDSKSNYTLTELSQGAIIYSSNSLLQIGKQTYEIIEIETSGKYIKLKKSDKIAHQPIGKGDKIVDLKVTMLSGKRKSLGQLLEEDKYLLVDFWGAWCKGCTMQLPDLKMFAENNKDKIQIIGLSQGDTEEAIKKYISKHQVEWPIGYANEELIKKLRVDAYPSYMLLNKKGEILLMKGSIEEISNIINQ